MAPKKASALTKTPTSKNTANTKAKVTKPAPAQLTKKATAAEKNSASKMAKPGPKRTTAKSKAASDAEAKKTTKTATKAAPKPKTAPKKPATKAPASTKRKRDEKEGLEPQAKKAKAEKAPTKAKAKPAPKPEKKLVKGPVINEPPTERLKVFVFGSNDDGALGLGTGQNVHKVKRPRLNPCLDPEKIGVVQLASGGMHAVALTADNKILTWGVNDSGALGRNTEWDGGYKDIDGGSSDSDSDTESILNPYESAPAEVDFSTTKIAEGTRWALVAAGDSSSFALTDDGRVYGWGTFRSNAGEENFTPDIKKAMRPVLLPDLKKITALAVGYNHALALDTNGAVWAWGRGEQSQLGRRMVERAVKSQKEGLTPRQFGLPKNSIVAIASGGYHSFALTKTGDVYSWGLNNFGETGHPENAGEDDAHILPAKVINALKGKKVVSIDGGDHHSVAATEDGECLTWGRVDDGQLGIPFDDLLQMPDDIVHISEIKRYLPKMPDDIVQKWEIIRKPRMVVAPLKVAAIQGEVTRVASNGETTFAITKEGKAWSWGFSECEQTGTGLEGIVQTATLIDNTAIREQKVVGAHPGGQFSVLTSTAA